jgi:hypothetical protein
VSSLYRLSSLLQFMHTLFLGRTCNYNASFLLSFLLDLLFYPEDGSDVFLRNVGSFSSDDLVSNQNLIYEEIWSRLNSGSACYHSFRNICVSFFVFCLKI